ncbi:MAG: three-Cys-motif partner protein TcmP [Chloroflexota bacterium]|nr:three-Cys-motif partner protein TcmP [Chloroflexota bacterium]
MKLEILRKYAEPYSRILSQQERPGFYHIYVDAFAGAGNFLSKRSGMLVPGSPKIALETQPPFREYHFIDIDRLKIRSLEQLAEGREDVQIHHGDCNYILMERILPRIRYEDFRRGLCILDPYGMHLNWTTVEEIGRMRSVEVFINFPVMDMNRNVLRREPSNIDPDQALRMNAFWGDQSWQDFYRPRPQLNL